MLKKKNYDNVNVISKGGDMKKFRLLIILLLIFSAVVGFSYSPAEEDCLEEFILCMQSIDITSPSSHDELTKCRVNDELCMFFSDMQ